MRGHRGLGSISIAFVSVTLLVALLASAALSSTTKILAHRADVSDVVSGDGAPFTWRFEYGTTTAYGQRTPDVADPGSEEDKRVSATLMRLEPLTKYHVRLTWDIGPGRETGDDFTFTTAAADDEPVDFAPAPAGDAPADPGGLPTTWPPMLGRSASALVVGGSVRLRLPGASASQALPQNARIPVGAVVDTRLGSVRLTTALPDGTTQAATFGGGIFEVRQAARLGGTVDILLRSGSRRGCPSATAPAAGARAAAVARRPPRELARLWGSDKGGRYRTHGANSVATVRGTRWLTVERCAGTLTKVSEGSVSVFDRRKGRRVLVKAGRSYLARRP